jgi:hypothetical protein
MARLLGSRAARLYGLSQLHKSNNQIQAIVRAKRTRQLWSRENADKSPITAS